MATLNICMIFILMIHVSHEYTVEYNCVTDYNEKGLCKIEDKCLESQVLNRTKGIAPTLCGLVQYVSTRIEIVCCTDINKLLKPESDWYFPDMRINEIKCRDFIGDRKKLQRIMYEVQASSNYVCTDGKCDAVVYPYVFGGISAGIDEFPHMALLGWKLIDSTQNNKYDWACGGSLISEDFILTAAHCLFADSPLYESNEPSMIRLGGSNPIEIQIANIIPHPEYKPPLKYNDIALIRLSTPIEKTLKIRPACLYSGKALTGNATTIGWGLTSEGGTKPETLQKVTLDIFNDDYCKEGYQNGRGTPNGILSSQFCAGSAQGGKDTCHGDSGGPMQIFNSLDSNIFDIIGITSYGAGCGSNYGGVYTKISYYIDWIENIVWNCKLSFNSNNNS